ncbi:hypothetical protein BGW37DRAFT_507107 [Umbelopsis sp. PMI_123]|nr:hypothetical protein BGW37DRAFT_507107 [Umbelopsis sp. PMI_123]
MKSFVLVCALLWVLVSSTLAQADLLSDIGQLFSTSPLNTVTTSKPPNAALPTNKPATTLHSSTPPLTSPKGTLLTATISPHPASATFLNPSNNTSLLPSSSLPNSTATTSATSLSLAPPSITPPPPSTPVVIVTRTIPPPSPTDGPVLAGGFTTNSANIKAVHIGCTGIISMIIALYASQ